MVISLFGFCHFKCTPLLNYFSSKGNTWPDMIVGRFFIAALVLLPATVFAQHEKISIDAFRVLGATPEHVDIEISGSNDGSMGALCMGAIAKSKDGTSRSAGFIPYFAPIDKQFHTELRVSRPDGAWKQQTDVVIVMVYQCGKDVVLKHQFDWSYVWTEKTASPTSGTNENTEFSRGRLWRTFSENLAEDDFGALDALIKKWNDPKERDENGEWKLDIFRSVFVDYSVQGRDWKGDLQRIQRWRTFNSKSAGAAIAEARYWTAFAWHIRGDERNVDPVAIRVFGERMKKAEKALIDSKEFASENPLWYESYLDIAVATKRDDKFIDSLFYEAIRKHPYFQPLYLDMAKHWAPRSGEHVDWKKVDEIVNQAVARTSDMDGMSNYALIYAQTDELQKLEFNMFQDSRASWQKMRDAFDDMVKRYPSADNLNEYAAYSCRAGDKATYLKIRAGIIDRIIPGKWPGNYSVDLCDHKYMQKI